MLTHRLGRNFLSGPKLWYHVSIMQCNICSWNNHKRNWKLSWRAAPDARNAKAQLVEALHYKRTGRRFDSRWCHWNFSLTWSFRPHYDPGVDSASDRNEYQEYFMGGKGGWCVELTLPSKCADCLEIWEPQPPGTPRSCSGLYRYCFTFSFLQGRTHTWETQ